MIGRSQLSDTGKENGPLITAIDGAEGIYMKRREQTDILPPVHLYYRLLYISCICSCGKKLRYHFKDHFQFYDFTIYAFM